MSNTPVNDNFALLPDSYLFSAVGAEVAHFRDSHPDARIISLGIGDVTRPIAPAVTQAMRRAVDDMASAETFRGYGPEQGYMFLRQAIADVDYAGRGMEIGSDEIFISDGAKSDLGNISDIFSRDCRVAVTDPVYPVYVDSNVMAGRAGQLTSQGWNRITYLPCTEATDFIPRLPETPVDLIYLCYPNNPTGTVLSAARLKEFVDYAREHKCIILYDSAYEAFISTPGVPRSIYEIEGAREVAIEFRSFSKTAGFTGLRCGYTVVPRGLTGKCADGSMLSLRDIWLRRQTTKFNGASYIIQRGAEAVYTPEGRSQIQAVIADYMRGARLLKAACVQAGLKTFGGTDAPYLWVKCPQGYDSQAFFRLLLERLCIVSTPGSGFGPAGEGYVRLTAFNTEAATAEAARRIAAIGEL